MTLKAIGPVAKLSLIIICRQMWLEWKISESKNTIDISQQDHSQSVNAGFWAPKSNSQSQIYEWLKRRSQCAKLKTVVTFSYDTVVKQKLLHWTIFFRWWNQYKWERFMSVLSSKVNSKGAFYKILFVLVEIWALKKCPHNNPPLKNKNTK